MLQAAQYCQTVGNLSAVSYCLFHRNDEYGFEIKYPTTSIFSFDVSGVIPKNKVDTDGCYILSENATNPFNIDISNVIPINEGKITIGNINFCRNVIYERAGIGYYKYYYTTSKNQNFYFFGYIVFDKCEGVIFSNYKDCLDSMKNYYNNALTGIQNSLATFKFTK